VTDDLRFQAIVARVQTLADNGLRVTLDLPEQAVVEAAQLMELKRLGAVLDVTVKPGKRDGEGYGL
jgi:predicted RNA-binding protein (virulence factor B family)